MGGAAFHAVAVWTNETRPRLPQAGRGCVRPRGSSGLRTMTDSGICDARAYPHDLHALARHRPAVRDGSRPRVRERAKPGFRPADGEYPTRDQGPGRATGTVATPAGVSRRDSAVRRSALLRDGAAAGDRGGGVAGDRGAGTRGGDRREAGRDPRHCRCHLPPLRGTTEVRAAESLERRRMPSASWNVTTESVGDLTDSLPRAQPALSRARRERSRPRSRPRPR